MGITKEMTLFLMFLVPSSQVQFSTLDTEQEDKMVYYVHRNTTIDNENSGNVYENENDCIIQCERTRCTYLVVEKTDKIWCRFGYDTSYQIKSTTKDIKFITREKNRCSGFCKKFTSAALCGICDCNDACVVDHPLRFRCDCTKSVKVMKSCAAINDSGNYKSGQYIINPDGKEPMEVSCYLNVKETTNQQLDCWKEEETHPIGHVNAVIRLGYIGTFDVCKKACLDRITSNTNYKGALLNSIKDCYCLRSFTKLNPSPNSASCYIKPHLVGRAQINPEAKILMMSRLKEGNGIYWKKSKEMYMKGFGEYGSGMWLGLNNIHRITTVFYTDIKVVMVGSMYNDVITTVYEDVEVKGEVDNFRLSYQRFNDMGARVTIEGLDIPRFINNSPFQYCSSKNWWCFGCIDEKVEPTRFSTTFAFGHVNVKSIVFYLITYGEK